MTKPLNFSFRLNLNRIIIKTLLISTIFTTFSGSIIFPSTKVYANANIGPSDVKKYAAIVIKMEKPRQQAYDKIKKILGEREKIPNIVCNDPKSFGELPGDAKQIANEYCKRSRKIVESNGLSIERFNKITEAAKRDNKVHQRIYDALIKEQGGRKIAK